MAAAFLGVLRLLGGEGPLLLAVDDLHWLDPATTRVLQFALRRLEHEPVGLLATVRVAPGIADPPDLRRALREERLLRVALRPLSVGALYEAIRLRLDLRLPRPTLLRVHAEAAGNPARSR